MGFSDPIIGAVELVHPAIKSPNFKLDPLTGWQINSAGQAWFASIIATGMVTGTNSVGWINATSAAFGADPTGEADSTTAIQKALNAAASNIRSPGKASVVYLPAGRYKVSAPITIPPGVTLLGDYADEVATNADFLSGTTIQASPTFSQGAAAGNAVILIVDQATGGYAKTSEEQKILGIMVDGHLLPGANKVNGIEFYGNCRRSRLENVLVAFVGGNGIAFVANSVSGHRSGNPRLKRVNVRNAGLAGFLIVRVSDGSYIDCLAESCTGIGWDITNMSNTTYIGCRSEHNLIGFRYTNTSNGTGSGGGRFIGCSTDRNERHGVEITSSNSTGVPLGLIGFSIRRDGRNGNRGGGGYAGLYIHAFPSAVEITGTEIFPGVDDDSAGVNSPENGVLLSGNNKAKTEVLFSSCHLQGATRAVSDDKSEAAVSMDGCAWATGTTRSPTVIYVNSATVRASANAILAIHNLTSAPSKASVQITGASAGDRALGINQAADHHQRIRIDTDGAIKWGPGNANTDTTLQRSAANALRVSKELTVDSTITYGSPSVTLGTDSAGYPQMTDNAGLTGKLSTSHGAQVGGTTVTNTNQTALGTLTVPFGDVENGAAYTIHASGSVTTGDSPPSSATFTLLWGGIGGTSIARLAIPTLNSNLSSAGWFVDVEIDWISIAETEVTLKVGWHTGQGVANTVEWFSVATTDGLATNAAKDLVLAFQWGSAPGGQTLRSDIVRFGRLA